MMTFKDCLREDNEVFLELEEYGEVVDLDGVKLRAQVIVNTAETDWDDIAHKQKNFYIHPDKHGIMLHGEYLTLYFKTCEYVAAKERLPKQSEYVKVNGARFKVDESQDSFGIARLVCSADRMNTVKPSAARLPALYE